jgi:hypothetical protein
VLALALAEAVYGSFETPPEFGDEAWLAALAAMSAYFSANASAVALLISLVERKRFFDVLLPQLGLRALHSAVSDSARARRDRPGTLRERARRRGSNA